MSVLRRNVAVPAVLESCVAVRRLGMDLMQNEEAQRLAKIETLVRALDTQFRVPLLGVRFGWDALIGLIPGIGDGVSALFSIDSNRSPVCFTI